MKIAILTNFANLNPGYSLTGITLDQKLMFQEHEHKVDLFVSENFNKDNEDVVCKAPHGELIDYQTEKDMSEESKTYSEKIYQFLEKEINNKYDLVITHDWIFTGWNLPFAKALQKLEYSQRTQYLHWIHSMPVGQKDWWYINKYQKNHSVVYPNKTDSINVLEQFRMLTAKQLEIIPHIKDLRTWFDFGKSSREIIKQYPQMMQGDFVKVYPVGTDRLFYKRVNIAISIMASLKKRSRRSICLCIANTNGSGRGTDERLEPYLDIAKEEGLSEDEFFFTSELTINGKEKRFHQGLDQRTLRELFLCANLLIYPTIQESFGLVGMEAPLAGAKIMVLNRSLNMMAEVHRNIGLYFNFGSFDQELNITDQQEYAAAIANAIIREYRSNSSVQSATWMRQAYNYDRMYTDYYLPIIGDIQCKDYQ